MSVFSKLKKGLTKTRRAFFDNFNSLLGSYKIIDGDFYEELEDILISSDMGVAATEDILEELQARVKEEKIKDVGEIKSLLLQVIKDQMGENENLYQFENEKSVVLVIGINGVGKTTSIGKLAYALKTQGKRVMIVAGDTFRAAATEQLDAWAKKVGVPIISSREGADPGAVLYDAIASAKSKDIDILLCDTAGRLHNKKNLMDELHKLYKIIQKEYGNAHIETLLVVDAATGQNALSQARAFNEVTDVSGLILTKLDGTPKGGVAIAISKELSIPVKYIGVGESMEDLEKFRKDEFIEALFAES